MFASFAKLFINKIKWKYFHVNKNLFPGNDGQKV